MDSSWTLTSNQISNSQIKLPSIQPVSDQKALPTSPIQSDQILKRIQDLVDM